MSAANLRIHSGSAAPNVLRLRHMTTEERLTELEIKLTHQDDLVDQLNAVVSEQQRQIDVLAKKLAALEKQSDDPTAPRNEKPPHY